MNKVFLTEEDRANGTQSICQDFLRQIDQQPIKITTAGFYVINRSLAASVRPQNKIPS